MQMCIRVALQRQPFGFAAVFLPKRRPKYSPYSKSSAIWCQPEAGCTSGGPVAGIGLPRRRRWCGGRNCADAARFVDDQFMCIADNKHFYCQYADVVQFIGQTLRHLPRLLLHVGTQSRRDDGVGEDAVFREYFRQGRKFARCHCSDGIR